MNSELRLPYFVSGEASTEQSSRHPNAPQALQKSGLAICVNWNGRAVLLETLQSLQACTYRPLDILVVDNASDDGSADLIPKEIEVLRLDRNLGYAGAINAGLRKKLSDGSGFDFALVLNNDLTVAPDLLERLLECANEKGPGIYGPQVRRSDSRDRLDAAWGEVVWNHVLVRLHGKGAPADDPRFRRTRTAEVLLGCALLISREVFQEVGLFDERFFMYHEEVDFQLRARKAGFPVVYCPAASCLHRGAHSTSDAPLQRVFWIRRNTVLFFRKHRPGPAKWVKFWLTLSLSAAYNLVIFRWGRLSAILRGVRSGLSDRSDRSDSSDQSDRSDWSDRSDGSDSK